MRASPTPSDEPEPAPEVSAALIEDVLFQLDRFDMIEAAWLLSGEIARLRGLLPLPSTRDGHEREPDDLPTAELYGEHGHDGTSLDRLVRAHHLARIGRHLLHVDAEDFRQLARSPWTPLEVATPLNMASWPTQIKGGNRGSLHSLLPLVRLVLEQIDVRHQRGDLPDVLAQVHLLSDYLPLLAWEPVLGHAGEPADLHARIEAARPEWGPDDGRCGQRGDLRDTAGATRAATKDVHQWGRYLQVRMVRTATLLGYCAGLPPDPPPGTRRRGACLRQCSMVPDDPDLRRSLALRSMVARGLRTSRILQVRHGSPVGHFFDVPDDEELAKQWRRTCSEISQLVEPWEGPERFPPVGEGALPGFGAIIGYVAGKTQPIRPAHVMTALVDRIRAELDPLDR